MLVADTYLGTRDDPTVAERLRTADPLTVVVDDTERRRSRFRTTAECGREVGVVVARDLDDGDVLDADGTPVVVRLEPIEALVVDFAGIDVPATTAVQVGHAVGNRHWSLAVRGEEVLLPVTDDRERMEAAVRPLLAEGADVEYAAVSPTSFDDAGNAHGGHGHDHAHPPWIGPIGPDHAGSGDDDHSPDEEEHQATRTHDDVTPVHRGESDRGGSAGRRGRPRDE